MLATILLALFTGGYLILAGGDIGIGMLLPRLGRSPAERRVVIAAITALVPQQRGVARGRRRLIAGAFPGLEHDLL
jgi:hypothetical protein